MAGKLTPGLPSEVVPHSLGGDQTPARGRGPVPRTHPPAHQLLDLLSDEQRNYAALFIKFVLKHSCMQHKCLKFIAIFVTLFWHFFVFIYP